MQAAYHPILLGFADTSAQYKYRYTVCKLPLLEITCNNVMGWGDNHNR